MVEPQKNDNCKDCEEIVYVRDNSVIMRKLFIRVIISMTVRKLSIFVLRTIVLVSSLAIYFGISDDPLIFPLKCHLLLFVPSFFILLHDVILLCRTR
ncbi:hypothetical protein RDI58_000516 [Solanum bulbocastanum]|uniref:Uncharacterized protein n=1 Tax=Solanum bulbocastanum TaxID=147425 RepID=A0AAN8U6A3_SOLBU